MKFSLYLLVVTALMSRVYSNRNYYKESNVKKQFIPVSFYYDSNGITNDAGAIQTPLTTQSFEADSYPNTYSIKAASRNENDQNFLQSITQQQGDDQASVQQEDGGNYESELNDVELVSEARPPTNQNHYQEDSSNEGLLGNQVNNLLSNGVNAEAPNSNTNFQERIDTDHFMNRPELDGNGSSDHLSDNQLEKGISKEIPVFHTEEGKVLEPNQTLPDGGTIIPHHVESTSVSQGTNNVNQTLPDEGVPAGSGGTIIPDYVERTSVSQGTDNVNQTLPDEGVPAGSGGTIIPDHVEITSVSQGTDNFNQTLPDEGAPPGSTGSIIPNHVESISVSQDTDNVLDSGLKGSANLNAMEESQGQQEMIVKNEMFSDTLVQQNIIKIEGKVTSPEPKGDCKGLWLAFDGGHVKFSSKSLKSLPKREMTFMTWIRIRKTILRSTVYSTAAAAGGVQLLEVIPASNMLSSFLRWKVDTGKNENLFTIQTEEIIPSGLWTYVTAKYDGTQGKAYLFVNGDKAIKKKDVPPGKDLVWGNDIVIGGLTNAAGKITFSFFGGMVNMRFVENAFDNTEIKTAYLQCKPPYGEIAYLVTVCSKDKLGSGTTSSAYIQVVGEDGEFGEIKLGNSFSSGCGKTLTIYGPYIGKIQKISIRKDSTGIGFKDWFLDKITISVESMPKVGEVYDFKCDCKLSDKTTMQKFIDATLLVNGGWSAWSEWSGCGTGMCGGDMKVRTRACTNPVPSEGGKKCMLQGKIFATFDNETAACPVDGNWGAWSPWSECDQICGGSKVTRTRACDNPAPKNNGKNCVGPKEETKMDCTQECEDWPVNGNWAEWGDWSACSKSCGGSVVTRKRTCSNPAPLRNGLPCEGDDTDTATDCTVHCPIDGAWTEWGPWTECSTTCGPGQQTRQRNCTNPPAAFGGKECPEKDSQEVKECKLVKCPNAVNGKWGNWGAWSACTEKEFCDQGEKKRTRKCDNPAPAEGGDPCIGSDTEDELCPKDKCKPLEGQTINLKPTSFITESCKAKTASFALNSKDIPKSIYADKILAGIKDIITTSYFAKIEVEQDDENVTKFCFQPKAPLAMQKLEKAFPGYGKTTSLPEFTKPTGTEDAAGLSVALKTDGSLHAVEFSLGEADQYAPVKDVVIKHVKFFFKEKPGERGIVAYGQHEFANSLFDVEFKLKSGPVLVGTSNTKTDLEAVINALSLPQATSLVGSPAVAAQDVLKNILIDYLLNLGLSKVKINDLKEALGNTTKIISGSVKVGATETFNVEVIKKKYFAIGLTSDQASVQGILDKLLVKLKGKKMPEGMGIFGSMINTQVGIAYAQKGFKVDAETSFVTEPLKSAFSSNAMKEGVFVAMRTQLPETCKGNVCKFFRALVGKPEKAKDTWLSFSIYGSKKGLELTASILGRKITENVELSKIELFLKAAFLPPSVMMEFRIGVKFPSPTGEIYIDNIKQPDEKWTLEGAISLSSVPTDLLGITLGMKGIWRKALGIPFLAIRDIKFSFKISTAGILSSFGFAGALELGTDCYYDDDFGKDGRCIRAGVDFNLGIGMEAKYVYGSLSPVTVGKIFRMFNSKLEIPEKIANSGFEKEVVVSFASKKQVIKYQGVEIQLKEGLSINGTLSILGFKIATAIVLSPKRVYFKVELSPLKLGKIEIFQSLANKTLGPVFYADAITYPSPSLEIYLRGATKIFDVETEIMFHFKPKLIEASFRLGLPLIKLEVEVYVKGTYGTKLEDYGFMAKLNVTSGHMEIKKNASATVENLVNRARTKIQEVRDRVKKQKEECKKKVINYCGKCKDVVCDTVRSNCQVALDEFKNYIGGAVNRFGGWFIGVAKKIASTFKNTRERRSVEFFPGRAQMMTRLRRKRFVGNYLCKTLAPAICKGSRSFCDASCQLPQHITKGVCKGLDLAHRSLFLVEDSFHWVKRIHDAYVTGLLKVHGIVFELELSPTVGVSADVSVDITILKVRRKISILSINLAELIKLGKAIADKAIAELKKMISKRYTDTTYDKPNNVGDVVVGAPFRICNSGSKCNFCITSPALMKGSSIGMSGCSGADSQWVYTLTGELLNMHSGLCLAFTGTGKDLKIVQQDCKINDENQRFTCEHNRIFLGNSKTDCLIEKASTGGKVVSAGTCTPPPKDETEDFEVPPEEEWAVKDDPRLKVCDNFVQDLALNKPATQSSTFNQKELTAEELKLVDEKERNLIFSHSGPGLAVNGDMSFALRNGSCSHTSYSKDPWWKVDLGAEHIITDVSIQTTSEGTKVDALKNFEIRVGVLQEFQKNPMCGERVTGTHLGELWTSTCDPAIPGRYVSVQAFGETHLTLCEVAVFARKDNQGKCSTELKRRRSNIATVPHKDRVLKRAKITYGRYD